MDQYRYRNRRENEIPSFSSTLLDVIYKSVDDREDEETVVYRKAMRNRQGIDRRFTYVDKDNIDKQIVDSFRRSGGNSKHIGDAVFRRKADTDFVTSSKYCSEVSSSEDERIYGFPARLKPLRTSIYEDEEVNLNTREMSRSMYGRKHEPDDLRQSVNREGKFVKTKSRAMKIYSYLKKGKQPNSPGGRLASFVISLFSTTNAKKSKISSSCNGGHDDAIVYANRKPKSASSFSRSCLNQNERFYPASVNVIGGYSQPRGHKSPKGETIHSPATKFVGNSINNELKKHLTVKNHQIEENTRNLLRNYKNKVEYKYNSPEINDEAAASSDDEASSYASSDLFELDHLSAIGIDRCMQELPLYETTSAESNRAIANGLVV